MDDIEIYNNSQFLLNKKIPHKIISWITILIIILIIFIIVIKVPYNKYNSYLGYIKVINNDSYLLVDLDKSDFPININNKLYIKDKEYKYDIVSIDDNLLTLKLNLDDNYLVNNNKILINILSKRASLLDTFLKKIKKGLNL